jgi:hypothetical protein
VTCDNIRHIPGNLNLVNSGVTQLNMVNLQSVGGNLNIQNNTNLWQTLIFGLTDVGGDFIFNENAMGDNLDLRPLRTVNGEFSLRGNPNLDSADMPAIGRIGSLSVENNPRFRLLFSPNLATIQGDVSYVNNDALTEVNMLSCNEIGGSIDVSNNANVRQILFGNLGTIPGDLTVTNNPQSTQVNTENIVAVDGDLTLEASNVGAFFVPSNLQRVGGDLNLKSQSLTGVDARQLNNVGGNINFEDNSQATTVEMPSLNNLGGVLNIKNNRILTSFVTQVGADKMGDISDNSGNCVVTLNQGTAQC